MAEHDPNEAAKKALAESREASDKTRAEAQEKLSKGKPTPTQEENDLAALGAHVADKEDDGSGPDPHVTRQVEAKKPGGGGYQTRAARPHGSSPTS